ncbi:tape measure protein [Pedobacter sp. AW1-32]|uniref:tape measure protein n=1 Tax=Pedobacter sp. AW1-32 TaxID=3383026 RepID=UPI003FF07367
MAKVSSNRGLNFTASLDITEAKRNAADLKKVLADLGVVAAKGMDTKPLTGYQQAQIGLKQSLLDSQKETERLRQESARYRAELEQGRVAQQANRTELERLRAVEQQLKNDLQQGKIAQQQYRTEIERNRVAQQQLSATLIQGRIDQQNLRTEITRMNLARRQEVEAARAARRAEQEVAGSYNEAQKRLQALGREIKSTADGFKRLTPELRAKIKEYNELNDALKKFDAQMGNHQRNVGNYRGAIKSAAQDLLGFASAYLSIGNALTYVFNQTLAFQRIKTPLSYILGSEGEANNKLAELKKLANDLGLQYFTIANSYRAFTAAARASNFDLAQSEKIFTSVTKASAVLGLSNEQLEGSLLAVQQMISKGNVQAEELRGQLSERLPGAFALAAKAMGVTEAELNKMLQTGQVVASELLPKLATELDKAYGDKASDGVKGLNAELGKLYTNLQSFAGEGSKLSENLFEPIIRGARQVIEELTQYTRGSFMENVRYAFTFSNSGLANQRRAYDLRDVRKNNENAQSEAEKYSIEGKSVGDLKTKYDQLTITMRSAVKAQNDFKKGVADGTLKETKDGTVQTYTAIANGIIEQRKRIGQAYAIAKSLEKSTNKEISDDALKSVTEIRKRIAELNKLAGSAIVGSDIYNRIEALKGRLKKPGSDYPEVQAQRALQAEIDALNKKGRNKQLSDDEQELADVDAKYKKLTEKAVKFNNDPKNKARGLRVDTGNLDYSRSSERDALIDKQASEKLKVTISEQKKLYEDFEEYKTAFGLAKAKERYKDLINVETTYERYLAGLEYNLHADPKAKGGDEDGYIRKQLEVVQAATKIAVEEEQKRTDKLLKEFMDYSQKRAVLIETYNRDYAALENNPQEQAQRKKVYEKDLKELDDANAKKLDSYQVLFEGIESLSRKQALAVLQSARSQLAKDIKSKAIVDPEEIAKIKKYFNDVENTIKEGSGKALTDLGKQIEDIAGSIPGINDAFKEVLSTLGGVLGQVGNIRRGFSELKVAQSTGSITGQLTAGFGIFSAGMAIFQSVVKLFDRSEQREAQAAYARDLQNKQTEALNKALERQVALLDDVYGIERIKNYDAAIKQARENQAKYASELTSRYVLTGDKDFDEILTNINNGNGTGIKGLFADKYIRDNQAKFDALKLPSDLNTLQRLLDEGKLDANTATIVTNLIKANETAEQLMNNLRAENTGTTLDQIAEDFISTLTDGTQDFGKTFETTIQKSILNGFKGELIRKQLQTFYTQFADLSEGGLTSDEIETLRASYLKASEQAKLDLEALSKATGIDLSTDSSKNSLSGAYSAASQDSINILSGYTAGVRLQLVKVEAATFNLGGGKSLGDLYLIAQSKLDTLLRIEANTLRTANNTDRLANIEMAVAQVAKNTSSTGSYNPALSASGTKVP